MQYGIGVLVILVAVLTIWRGTEVIRGKRRPRLKSYERSLTQNMTPDELTRYGKLSGWLSFIYGLLLIGLGVWMILK
jgi:hypothetical protein